MNLAIIYWDTWEKQTEFRSENQKGREIGRPRCRWGDTIKADLEEAAYEYVEWIRLVQDRNIYHRGLLWER
jgi:hypothetical protein